MATELSAARASASRGVAALKVLCLGRQGQCRGPLFVRRCVVACFVGAGRLLLGLRGRLSRQVLLAMGLVRLVKGQDRGDYGDGQDHGEAGHQPLQTSVRPPLFRALSVTVLHARREKCLFGDAEMPLVNLRGRVEAQPAIKVGIAARTFVPVDDCRLQPCDDAEFFAVVIQP